MFTKTVIDKEHQLSLKSKFYWNRLLFQLFSPWLFPSNCDYMFGLDESGGNSITLYMYTVYR